MYTLLSSNMKNWKLSGKIGALVCDFALKVSSFLFSTVTAQFSVFKENAPGIQIGSQKGLP